LEETTLPNGLEIWHLDGAETQILYTEIFEERTYLQNGIDLGADSVVFDVGANIGLAALFFANVCRVREIYAFEPAPAVYEVLAKNFAMHQLGGRALPYAISNSRGQTTFTYYPRASVMSGFYPDPEGDAMISRRALEQMDLPPEDIEWMLHRKYLRETVECECCTVSDAIRMTGVPRIDLLKVDAEKSEFDVLTGIEDDDWPRVQQVVAEVHDIDGRLRKLRVMLSSRGFSVDVGQEPVLAGSEMYTLSARRSPPGPA
jgi:FkbM family methyltransferase